MYAQHLTIHYKLFINGATLAFKSLASRHADDLPNYIGSGLHLAEGQLFMQLEFLNVNDNQLTGTLPAEWDKLISVSSLTLVCVLVFRTFAKLALCRKLRTKT